MKQNNNKIARHGLFSMFALCLCMAGCSSEDNGLPQGNSDTRVPLSVSGTVGLDFSRVSGSTWESGDCIGVFMASDGEALAFNHRYKHGGNNLFLPASATDSIWFPQDTLQTVDFIAYYPHTDIDKENKAFPIDLSSQTDYLYAPRVTGCNRTNPQVSFSFAHLLSRIEVELIAGEGMKEEDLVGASVTLSGVPVTATCSLADGTLDISDSNAGTLALSGGSSFLLPDSGGSGRNLLLTLPGYTKNFVWEIPSGKSFRAGESTVYHITIKKTEVEKPEEPDTPDEPDVPDTPEDPQITLVVTSRITDWLPGNGGGEEGSAQ